GYEGRVDEVKMLGNSQICDFTETKDGLRIYLQTLDTDHIPVLKVSFKDGYVVKPYNVIQKGLLSHHNAVHTYGHSSQDYYGGYKSLIGYDWSFKTNKKKINPSIYFTDNEKDKLVSIRIDDTEQQIKLLRENSKTIYLSKSSVKLGSLYSKRGRGVFGYIEEEQGTIIPTNVIKENWTPIEEFNYGEKQSVKLNPRGSILMMQEIESTKNQTIAVELGTGNAVYVLLNGEYITAHFSPERKEWQTETLLLPLKKGMNQLVIKHFNRFEDKLNYSIKPLDSWQVYTLLLQPFVLSSDKGGVHKVSMILAEPNSKVSPLRLNNIEIKVF
ncbi:MAG: hypothetical protein GX857_03915, partial [Bacteroidales bacterium]|nr:hypothetical protein [Bacteroidales bacterium]